MLDMKKIVKSATMQGWRVERTQKCHWKFIPPDVTIPVIITSGTPSDHRAMRNFTSDLRRAGFQL